MNFQFLIITFLAGISVSKAWTQISGTYMATLNGDNVVVQIEQNNEKVTGKMKDSNQSYTINGLVTSTGWSATAVEESYGIQIDLVAKQDQHSVLIDASINYLGSNEKIFSEVFYRNEQPHERSGDNHVNASTAAVSGFLKNKTLDPRLIGKWRTESHYNSGYGSDFSGSTYSYIIINANLTMSDGGSSANISGGNYSGNSSDLTESIIPDMFIYSEGNTIMAYTKVNGTFQALPLGTYFIENNTMLFTQANTAQKILYYKM